MARSPSSSNHETLMLTLALLKMIPKTGKISTTEIRERLLSLGYVRDVRSIQRQLEALAANFPIERDVSSKPYGYKWQAGAAGISIPSLTLEESLLITLAEKYLRNLLPPSVTKSMAGFFAQARMNMGHSPDERLERRWMDKVDVVSTSVPLLPPNIAVGVLEAVTSTLYFERYLDIDYTNARGERKQKRVTPLGLVQQGARLVLVARFESYNNERSLALNRMHVATDTGFPHPKVKNFELSQYDADGRFGLGDGKRIKLRFRIEKRSGVFLTESRLSKDQTVVELDGQYEITATVVQSPQLLWWLRGFGTRVTVLEPAQLL